MKKNKNTAKKLMKNMSNKKTSRANSTTTTTTISWLFFSKWFFFMCTLYMAEYLQAIHTYTGLYIYLERFLLVWESAEVFFSFSKKKISIKFKWKRKTQLSTELRSWISLYIYAMIQIFSRLLSCSATYALYVVFIVLIVFLSVPLLFFISFGCCAVLFLFQIVSIE